MRGVLAIALLGLACKGDSRGRSSSQATAGSAVQIVVDAALDAPPAKLEPVRVADILDQARTMAPGVVPSSIRIEKARADGMLDPGGTVELRFGAAPGTTSRGCPKVIWESGGWTVTVGECEAATVAMRCSVEAIWQRAIDKGALRGATANLAWTGAMWRFELVQAESGEGFVQTFADDCELKVETDDLPATVTLEMVTEALQPVRPQIDACRTETTPHGLVKVRMKIDSDGVPHAEVQSTRVRALGECVVKAVNEARFPRTRHGAELTYPFPF